MESIILSKRNCHRAAKVRNISGDYENVIWDFEWRGIRSREGFMHTEYAHSIVVISPETGLPFMREKIADFEGEMKKWEVVAWKYEYNLDDLWEDAVRAFGGTSFNPEERAAVNIREYEKCLLSDLPDIPEEEQQAYVDKFKEKVRGLFYRHSRIISAAIVGPAKFPTARNEKANNSYGKALEEFDQWRSSYAKGIARRLEAAKSPEQKSEEEWNHIKGDILENATTCADIDNGRNTYSYRTAFTNSIFGKVERLAHKGKSALVIKALDYIKELQGDERVGLKKPLFTDRHKIWKLREVCERAVQAQEAMAGRESVNIRVKEGVVVKNYAEDRLQILFDEKPAPDMIACLKSNGFRWSPRFGAWQRQLTSNAYYGTARVLFGNDVLSEERQQFINRLSHA